MTSLQQVAHMLGADDKAGVAIIMDFANYMMNNPEAKHGNIRLLFTPDEEIGRGVDHLDMKKLNADYGYMIVECLECLMKKLFQRRGKYCISGVSANSGRKK